MGCGILEQFEKQLRVMTKDGAPKHDITKLKNARNEYVTSLFIDNNLLNDERATVDSVLESRLPPRITEEVEQLDEAITAAFEEAKSSKTYEGNFLEKSDKREQEVLKNISFLEGVIEDISGKLARANVRLANTATTKGRESNTKDVVKYTEALNKQQGYLQDATARLYNIAENREFTNKAYERADELVVKKLEIIDKYNKKVAKHYVGGRILANETPTIIGGDVFKLSDTFTYSKKASSLAVVDDIFGKGFEDALQLSTLNVSDIADAFDAKERVTHFKEVITKYIKNEYSQKKTTKAAVGEVASVSDYQSIHRLLLEGKGGSYTLPDVIVTALAVNMLDWLASMKDNRAEHRSDDQINGFFGRTKGSAITTKDREVIADIDVLLRVAATDIGISTNKLLGLKAKQVDGQNTEPRADKLAVELGLIAMEALKNSDYVETVKVIKGDVFDSDSTQELTVVKITDNEAGYLYGEDSNINRDAAVASKLVQVSSRTTTYNLAAPVTDREVKNSAYGELFDLSDDQIQAVNRAEKVAYTPASYYINSIRDMISDPESKERLRTAMGVRDPKNVHVNQRKGTTSKNNTIDKEIKDLIEMDDHLRSENTDKLWYNFKIISTGRYYVESSGFNSQAKKIHKFGASPDTVVTVTKDNEAHALNIIGQGLGVDIDKLTPKTITSQTNGLIEAFRDMFDKGLTDLDILEKFIAKEIEVNGKAFKPHSAAHGLAGIVETRRYLEFIKDNGDHYGFEMDLYGETDATTSGHSNKMLQMPLYNDNMDELTKVGVFLEGATTSDGTTITSYGQLAEDPNFTDAYNTPAKTMTGKLGTINEKFINNRWKKKPTGKKLENANASVNRVKELGVKAGLTEAIEEIEREFMKDPFMTFGYGSALKSISIKLGKDSLNTFDELLTPDDIMQAIAVLSGAATISQSKEVAAGILVDINNLKAIHTNPKKLLEYKISPIAAKAISSGVTDILGEALSDTFKERYGVSILAGQIINTAQSTSFKLFKRKYDRLVDAKELELGSIPTKAQIKARTPYRKTFSADEVVAELAEENKKKGKRVSLTVKQKVVIAYSIKESLPAISTALSSKSDNVKILTSKIGQELRSDSLKYGETGQASVLNKDGSAARANTSEMTFVDAHKAGIVNMTQNIDAAIITEVLKDYDLMGIQDAVMHSADTILDGTRTYNVGTGKAATEYSMTTAVVNSFADSLNASSKEDIDAINTELAEEFHRVNAERLEIGLNAIPDFAMTSVLSIYKDMVDLRNSSETSREQIFNKKFIVEHAAYPGSAVTFNEKGSATFYKRPAMDIKWADHLAEFEKITYTDEVTKTQDAYAKKLSNESAKKGAVGITYVTTKEAAKELVKDGAIWVGNFGIFSNPFGTYDNNLIKIDSNDFKNAAKYYFEWIAHGKIPEDYAKNITPDVKKQLVAKVNTIRAAIKNPNSDIRTKHMVVMTKDVDKATKYDSVQKRLLQLIMMKGGIPVNSKGSEVDTSTSTEPLTSEAGKFDKQLDAKLRRILKILYPDIKLEYTTAQILHAEGVMNQEVVNNTVKLGLKVVEALTELGTAKPSKHGGTSQPVLSTIRLKNEAGIRKKLAAKDVSKEQIDFVFEYMRQNSIGEISSTELAERVLMGLATGVEVSTQVTTTKQMGKGSRNDADIDWIEENILEMEEDLDNAETDDEITRIQVNIAKEQAKLDEFKSPGRTINTKYYEDLNVPGGTNYQEKEIATPSIVAPLKGHANFATDKGIGWYRVDDSVEQEDTLRVLEMQSDMFQKMKGTDLSTGEDTSDPYGMFSEDGNSSVKQDLNRSFLQLLNTDNKWVKFFIQSIVQDSQKNGYEKIRFPAGETAAKVEGHESIAEQIVEYDKTIKSREVEIRDINEDLKSYNNDAEAKHKQEMYNLQKKKEEFTSHAKSTLSGEELIIELDEINEGYQNAVRETDIELADNSPLLSLARTKRDLKDLQKQRHELKTQGIEKLAPIEGFYQVRVRNTLQKTYGKKNVKTVTDEHGNQWFELTLDSKRDSNTIMLQTTGTNQIKGQINLDEMKILINSLLQSQDTLPHEYAHYYIAMFRDAPIVQEAIRKWGSEEKLVQAIGEQVVEQKGEVYGWWKEFTKWLQGKFNKLDNKTKEELRNLLTDSFLTAKDLDKATPFTSELDSDTMSELEDNGNLSKEAVTEGKKILEEAACIK